MKKWKNSLNKIVVNFNIVLEDSFEGRFPVLLINYYEWFIVGVLWDDMGALIFWLSLKEFESWMLGFGFMINYVYNLPVIHQSHFVFARPPSECRHYYLSKLRSPCIRVLQWWYRRLQGIDCRCWLLYHWLSTNKQTIKPPNILEPLSEEPNSWG